MQERREVIGRDVEVVATSAREEKEGESTHSKAANTAAKSRHTAKCREKQSETDSMAEKKFRVETNKGARRKGEQKGTER